MTAARAVTVTITDNEFHGGVDPRSAAFDPTYASMLDMRRRVLANAWARAADLSGPGDGALGLSIDNFRENGTTCPYASGCTSMPFAERDRLEVYWAWDYAVPEDTVVGTAFNDPFPTSRQSLTVPPAGSNSMLFPGMHFRFFTGPAVVYPNTPTTRWVPLPDPRPIGEAKGFLANTLLLTPSVPAARGNTLPPTFTAYERATIALIGAPTGHDSVSFLLDPAVTRPTIAAWTQAGSAFLFARCGMMPTQTVWDAQVVVGTGGAVLDLTAGCPSAWNVVAVNFTTADRVMHIRVGASTSASRVYDLVLGTEFTAPAPELAFIQRVLRQAAWRFYGATGGTHIIRSWTTMNGTCSGSHVCFRNRATCSPQAITHPSGSTPSWSTDICRNTSGFTAASNPENLRDDGRLLAHEFGHLLTMNGVFNQLGDEYGQIAPCGGPSFQMTHCSHSLMGTIDFWRRINSLCTASSHARVRQVFGQGGAPLATSLLGSRSLPGGTGVTSTITECANGTIESVTGGGSPAWQVLANTGAAPLPHPPWSPDNHDYINFADGPSVVVGRIL